MRLVIDGYNLIHTVPELAFASDRGQGREALIEALRLYRKKRSHKISVVFDGGLEPGGKDTRAAGVPVKFSGVGRSADDVIAAIAAQDGGGLTVVTSDRELAGRCRVHGAVVLSSEEFGDRLLEVVMGGAGMGGDEDQGWDFSTKKKGPSKRLPKAKRKKARRKNRL
ncbi:MAG: NYN domain-containing protein [Desulfarculaceae bacterium]|nr:NYN domain-containing protein [Desulfarculaceae bacterium]MCF8071922.1 NYN domain-containing protein [Desulfarculaceae bacterium]MCF8103722.1 NYN domain-containing protein [Desulfarculaceae bacterium]MCF8114989.1 NYN domain-containing protein [Desulfarculaceae bacterium]